MNYEKIWKWSQNTTIWWYLILGLSKDWIKVFDELPKFESMIDKKGRLILRSTKSIKYTESKK